jgi:hypothetical protein
MAVVLMRNGSDCDSADFEGKKPLDIALNHDYKDMVNAVMHHLQYAVKRKALSGK